MKKMRLHIYIALGVFIVGFIVGSFVDKTLMEAVFSRGNGFGIFMSTIGTLPGYMMLAVIGGGFVALAFNKYKVIYRIILYVVAAACFVCAIYFSGREFFGENGFYNEKLVWVGYLIALPFAVGCGFLGIILVKNSKTPYLWLILAIIAFFIFMSLVPGVTLLKGIFHRPRYRTLSLYEGIEYHSWWQRCSNYKDLMAAYGVSKEEFKSFPSGHAGASAVFMLCAAFLPLLDKKYEKLSLILFYSGFAWVLFVSFTRILVGAHFLSDVSMGGILTLGFTLIANEILIAVNKKLALQKEEQVNN